MTVSVTDAAKKTSDVRMIPSIGLCSPLVAIMPRCASKRERDGVARVHFESDLTDRLATDKWRTG